MSDYQFSYTPPSAPPGHPDGLAAHLGGHENETHLDEGAVDYLRLNCLIVKSYV